MERMLTMLEPGGIPGGKMLHQHERRGDIDPNSLLPFNRCDFTKRFYDCDARVVHEQIQRIPSNVME